MEIRLRVVNGPTAGREFALPGHERLCLGRSLHANVCLPEDPQVSKMHCAIGFAQGVLVVDDLDSLGGTWLNGRRVNQAVMRSGDWLRVGATDLELTLIGAPPAGAQAPVPCFECQRPFPVDHGRRDSEGWVEGEYCCPECRARLAAPHRGEFSPVGLGREETVGPYVIEQRISVTPGARLYVAREPGAAERVALKVLSLLDDRDDPEAPRRLLRFVREAHNLQRLHHPSIVRLHRFGYADNQVFLAMDYLPGGDLQQRVEETGPLSLGDACRFVVQALEGLAHAHARGVVHRDLKPENLLLTSRDAGARVKIADLGISKCLQASGRIDISSRNDTAGTFDYMAPEQIERYAEALPAFDIYALAATLQTLITGRSIYRAAAAGTSAPRGLLQWIEVIRTGDRVRPRELRPELPEAFEASLERALDAHPDRRPSAREFAELLQPFAGPAAASS